MRQALAAHPVRGAVAHDLRRRACAL